MKTGGETTQQAGAAAVGCMHGAVVMMFWEQWGGW